MNRLMPPVRLMIAIFSLCGLLATANAHAVEAGVEVHGSQQYANINESGLSFAASALITFVVQQNGVGVDLGVGSYGDGTTAISLPVGMSILNVVTPVGGCGFTTTQFFSWQEGQYAIRLVPFTGNATCKWVAGDYIVRIKVDRNGYQGTDLGILTIK